MDERSAHDQGSRDAAQPQFARASSIFVLSMVTWVVFSGQMDAFHLTLGAISSMMIALTTRDVFIFRSDQSVGQKIAMMGRMAVYVVWLLMEIVRANVHVFALALKRDVRHAIDPRIISFKTKLKGDLAKFVLANSITLTPGTVTIKIVDGEFIVHAISEQAATGLQEAMEVRVAHVFGEAI